MIRSRPLALLSTLLLALAIAGCSTPGKKRGGYYKDDGPDANPPSNLDNVPDATPRLEPLASGPNRPYVVFGKRYVPDTSERPFRQQGLASWYGKKFHGNSTSNGESYDMYAMTAAHPTMPIPSYARVTSKINGRTVIVRVNDRGPFHSDRIMDLSYVAAHKLGIIGPGSGPVTVERILPAEILAMNGGAAAPSARVPARCTRPATGSCRRAPGGRSAGGCPMRICARWRYTSPARTCPIRRRRASKPR
ncbi:septal ring lytic transglycosylase RlpA family protein, partial [Bordetella pertussis]|uniref:septal ring lytic transglycosylase RlpA family protein n=1 Tax=Bordetella pertussis TaxID=520 RepID=UPI0036724E0F